MQTSLFDFHLPEDRIAHMPPEKREDARLLHVTSSQFHDRHIYALTDMFDAEDVLVFNNTRVIPARLYGRRGEMFVELLLHKCLSALHWRCFARPGKRLKVGQTLVFSSEDATLTATLTEKCDSGEVVVRFDCADTETFWQALEKIGQIPLPPYIARKDGHTAEDRERYQTVYARHAGSVAAPTAGLHFTNDLLAGLRAKGVEMHEITLHVGGGTFLPVKAEDTADHVMHSEYGEILPSVADALNEAKRSGKRIVAVGTTSLRTLESATDADGTIRPFAAETSIFITPGYRFRAVDRLLTNFHLPKSTLFMLVSAFSGRERMHAAYAHAIARNYRFYSYGRCLPAGADPFP